MVQESIMGQILCSIGSGNPGYPFALAFLQKILVIEFDLYRTPVECATNSGYGIHMPMSIFDEQNRIFNFHAEP